MKTKIVIVEPVEDILSKIYIQSLLNHCRGNHTGMIFTDDDMNPYWFTLKKRALDFGEVIDFSRFEVRSRSLERVATESPSLLCIRHFEAQSYFMRVVGDVRSIYEEIYDKDIQVVVTDFYKGFFLYKSYPDKFSLVFLDLVSDNDMERAYSELFEFRMLRRISPFSESYIDGTWDMAYPENGRFEIHFSEDPRIGSTQGLIADTRGLATFVGKIGKNCLEFRKVYFQSSVDEDWKRHDKLIDRTPINYAIYGGFMEGHFWWDGRESEFRHCICQVKQRIGYT